MLLWSSYCSSIGWHYFVCLYFMVVFLTDIVLLFKNLFGFPREVHLDGCTSFYFQYFWNEWSWSFISSMGSFSLFTLYTSRKRWEQRAHCMWLSYIWNFLFTTAYALITNFTLFYFLCLQDVDHIGYVRQAFEARSLHYFLEILQCDILKDYDVSYSFLGCYKYVSCSSQRKVCMLLLYIDLLMLESMVC